MASQVELEKMSIATTVNFKYFVSLAMQNKMSWEGLAFVLDDLASTLPKSKEVIQVLLKELQKLQSRYSEEGKEVIQIDDHQLNFENEMMETDDTAIDRDSNDFEDQNSIENGCESEDAFEYVDINDFDEEKSKDVLEYSTESKDIDNHENRLANDGDEDDSVSGDLKDFQMIQQTCFKQNLKLLKIW